MNLIYRLKLATKQVNPFVIKDQFKCKIDYASLINRQQITPDTYLLRFALSEQNKCLGTQIGQYLSINDPQFDKDLSRFYVPISRIDDEGIMDILVRAVPSEKRFSVHLSQMKENTQIKLGGPFTSFLYNGFGQFTLQNQNHNYRKIGLIAEGSGIASFFQLIEGIATNGDKTHVGLLYIDDSMEDFALLEELIWLAEEKKIQVSFLSRKSNSLWSGLKGELTEHHLENYLPPPNDDTLIMISGRTSFKEQTQTMMKKLNHQNVYII